MSHIGFFSRWCLWTFIKIKNIELWWVHYCDSDVLLLYLFQGSRLFLDIVERRMWSYFIFYWSFTNSLICVIVNIHKKRYIARGPRRSRNVSSSRNLKARTITKRVQWTIICTQYEARSCTTIHTTLTQSLAKWEALTTISSVYSRLHISQQTVENQRRRLRLL